MLEVTPLRALRDNYIWMLQRPRGQSVVAVDPSESGPVRDYLDRHRLSLAAILVTHHHPDHVGGVPGLAGGGVPVYGPASERIPERTRGLSDGEQIEIDAIQARFTVLDIPGHTSGHIAYHGEGLVLSGDTLFAVGCGKLFEGSAEQMQRSLARLRDLPPETRVCCGHEYTVNNIRFALAVEPDNEALQSRRDEAGAQREAGQPTLPSTIAAERETNPFLRWDAATVRDAASRHAGRELSDPVAVFAELRRWKDRF